MLQGLSEKLLGQSLAKPAVLIAAYGAWILVFRLMCLSFVVYFLTRAGHPTTFEEINESFGNNEILFIGLCSACFLLLMKGLAPLIDREQPFGFSWKEFRSSYIPGFLQGTVLATGVVAALLVVGSVRIVGFFVQIEDTGLAVFGIVLRAIALLAIGLCDEFLFRRWEMRLPSRIVAVTLLYCVVKLAQFDLSWMHFVTLFLFSTTLAVRRINEGTFLGGAGFISAILIVFHPVFSLPVFGSDFSGIFLLKYQSQTTLPALISGGAGGPLSSVAFQAVLVAETLRGWISHQRSVK